MEATPRPLVIVPMDLVEALDSRCLFINPDIMDRSADEIDCAGNCESAWHEWDTNASGCRASERGDHCANDVAETLRALAKVSRSLGDRPKFTAYHPERDKLLQEAVAVLTDLTASIWWNNAEGCSQAIINSARRADTLLSKLKETPAAPPPQEDK